MMTSKERAEKMYGQMFKSDIQITPEWIAAEIRAAVEEANTDIAMKQALVHGEGVMLGGKVVTNEELYKQPTDYIREAKAEAYEDAAKIAETPLPNGSILPVRGEPTNPGAIVDATKALVAKQIRARATEFGK